MIHTQAQIEAVRERLQGYHDFLPDEAIAAALTAAAEVGSTHSVTPEMADGMADWINDKHTKAMREAIAASIERCAQVAEAHRGGGGAGGISNIRNEIAAAIRKLKEK